MSSLPRTSCFRKLTLSTLPKASASAADYPKFITDINTRLHDVFMRIISTRREDTGVTVVGLVQTCSGSLIERERERERDRQTDRQRQRQRQRQTERQRQIEMKIHAQCSTFRHLQGE